MQEFFQNVSRYPRYLISFSLGIFFFFFDQLKPFFKKPVTAIALIGLIISSFSFLTLTLRAMFNLS
ncbi:MAG: DUF751 family protein [Cyanobacteriota bacterium]|nr:DUF751 family protein [Cyanobacteriota bacterium]